MITMSLILMLNSCNTILTTPTWEIKRCETYFKTCIKNDDTTYDCYLYYNDSIDLKNCNQAAVFNNVGYFECDYNLSCIGSTSETGLFITCCDDEECTTLVENKKEC